jgi:hypothetical protein
MFSTYISRAIHIITNYKSPHLFLKNKFVDISTINIKVSNFNVPQLYELSLMWILWNLITTKNPIAWIYDNE